jgi:hypothetical protein
MLLPKCHETRHSNQRRLLFCLQLARENESLRALLRERLDEPLASRTDEATARSRPTSSRAGWRGLRQPFVFVWAMRKHATGNAVFRDGLRAIRRTA